MALKTGPDGPVFLWRKKGAIGGHGLAALQVSALGSMVNYSYVILATPTGRYNLSSCACYRNYLPLRLILVLCSLSFKGTWVNKVKLALLIAVGTMGGGSLAAQEAAQGVEIYGDVRLSVDVSKNGQKPGTGKDNSALSVNSNTSILGFKGKEKLSDKLSVIWQYESEVELDEGNIAVKGRDTFGGLTGSWGELKAGKLSNPMKEVSNKIDIFVNTRADHNALIGYVNGVNAFDNRLNNTILYSTPTFAGVRLDLSYTTDSDEDALPDKRIAPKKSITSFSLSYDKGPLFMAIATEAKNDAKLNDNGQYDAISATKLVGRWDFGQGTTVGLVYEDADNSAGAEYTTSINSPVTVTNGALDTTVTRIVNASPDGQARSVYYLNASHKIGNTTLKGAYGRADDLSNNANSGATHYTLGVYQSYSKDTQLYVIYTATDNDAGAKYGLKDMSGVPGKTISALSFGLNKRFSLK